LNIVIANIHDITDSHQSATDNLRPALMASRLLARDAVGDLGFLRSYGRALAATGSGQDSDRRIHDLQ
jgi:hypothetical protein